MLIHVRFFAILRELNQTAEWEMECAAGATVGEAAEKICARFPALAKYPNRIAYAVNQNWRTNSETVLQDGDELALIPPVSGGAEADWIEIMPTPLDVERALAFVADKTAGGIDIFLGTTRGETNADGNTLLALDYEAYEEMAVKQLHELAAEARKKWPIARLVILHRTGRVEVSKPSVLVAVACPHRAEAFDACRWLIDQLKQSAAIWKKEIWQGGSASWSGE